MDHSCGALLISLKEAALRIRDRVVLSDISWEIRSGQNWAVLGPNGAGKSTLVRALAGEGAVVRGSLNRRETLGRRIGFVSFEIQRDLELAEQNLNFARHFSGKPHERTSARQILFSQTSSVDLHKIPIDEQFVIPDEIRDIVSRLKIESFLDQGLGTLSTGQMRKLLIARALVKSPELLILDEPFDGLDRKTRLILFEAFEKIMEAKIPVILVSHRLDELPEELTHAALIKAGKMIMQGEKKEVLTSANLAELYIHPEIQKAVDVTDKKIPRSGKEEILSLKNGNAGYGSFKVFENLNWIVCKDENWAIWGPNGAGKSTLLSMISADSPKAYANELKIFGKKRGSGESIWDIKKRIGVVSAEFQIRYSKKITAFDVVLSGFFDSVGLYRLADKQQIMKALEWTAFLGLNPLKNRIFSQLSHGEQRMVLIARSMVKSPEILILDEPCQGLDMANRRAVLKIIESIGNRSGTQLLYVTHHAGEIPSCTTHVLVFEPLDSGGFTARSKNIKEMFLS